MVKIVSNRNSLFAPEFSDLSLKKIEKKEEK
jgi:hypothetical protein